MDLLVTADADGVVIVRSFSNPDNLIGQFKPMEDSGESSGDTCEMANVKFNTVR